MLPWSRETVPRDGLFFVGEALMEFRELGSFGSALN